MLMKSLPPLALTVALASLLLLSTSCRSIDPQTGAVQRANLYSPEKEIALGLTEFRKIKSQKRISTNPTYNAQLERVGARLAKVMPLPGAEWEFVVFEDSSPNAFALPGGKVGIHTGLFPITKNDAGLAAVVGHEVAHVVARHSGQRLTNATLSTAAVLGANVALNRSDIDNKAATAAVAGAAFLNQQRFSRVQELEADRLGMLYMARAGYDPREAVRLWERFAQWRQQNQRGPRTPGMLSTHPVDERRMADLQAALPEAMALYRQSQ